MQTPPSVIKSALTSYLDQDCTEWTSDTPAPINVRMLCWTWIACCSECPWGGFREKRRFDSPVTITNIIGKCHRVDIFSGKSQAFLQKPTPHHNYRGSMGALLQPVLHIWSAKQHSQLEAQLLHGFSSRLRCVFRLECQFSDSAHILDSNIHDPEKQRYTLIFRLLFGDRSHPCTQNGCRGNVFG